MYSLTAPTIPIRSQVLALQRAMMAVPDNHIQIVPTHLFADGLYGRTGTIPEGATAIGHIHAQEHICVISKGRVQIVTDDGVNEIIAPAVFVVPAGRKNCVHALEDTVWTTVHASDAKTVRDAEEALIAPETVVGEALPLPYERAAKCL